MTRRRRSHTAHRWRIISRCFDCRCPLLLGCSYRSRLGECIETRSVDVPRHKLACPRSGERSTPRARRSRLTFAERARDAFGDAVLETLL